MTQAGSGSVTLRLGFLANVTHAPALVGIKKGFFTKDLGNGVTLKLTPFSTGTEESTALLAGQLDAAYVGPNPAIKAWQTSDGKLIKIISGAASGGAALVVKKSITGASQLKGQSLATPSLGNTQDVALRYWLKQHSLTDHPDRRRRCLDQAGLAELGAVLEFTVRPDRRAAGSPRPTTWRWCQAGGHVLVNEATLWPGGQFVTTNLVVTQAFLAAHPVPSTGCSRARFEAN